MMTRYASEKGLLTGVILASVFTLIMVLQFFLSAGVGSLIFVGVCALLAWLWFGTWYGIDNQYVYYASGPWQGRIALAAIREVVCNETMWYGYRPALAPRGVIVRYGQSDEIYFSPKDQKAFVEGLKKINPDIHVHEAAARA